MNRRKMSFLGLVPGGLVLGLLGACGSRSERYSEPFSFEEAVSLTGSVAVYDAAMDRVIFLRAASEKAVSTHIEAVGRNVVAMKASVDQEKLYVLSSGDSERREKDRQKPALEVFSGGTKIEDPIRFEFDDPMGELALDPEGRYLVAFALSDEQGAAFVRNPNEIVILDLEDADREPRPFSIRSFGGSPRAISFTGPLTLPSGRTTRFLVVRTDRDLALIDLSDLEREEITVQLPTDEEDSPLMPLEVVSDDGDADSDDDARFAIRLAQSADVVLLQLVEPSEEGKEFSVNVNIVDVGGEPSAIDFVRTDGGLRLAALIPSRSRATLVHPETTLSEVVELGAPFASMKRITESGADLPEGGDVALLTGADQKFAFWSLGSTSGTPYRSIDTTEIELVVTQIIDIPEPNEHLKVLVGEDTPLFYVLDLTRREAAPFRAQSSGFQVRASSDGLRLWVNSPGEERFSMIDLEELHPTEVEVVPAPRAIFEVSAADGGKSALGLHGQFSLAATVFDAEEPSSDETRYFPGLDLSEVP